MVTPAGWRAGWLGVVPSEGQDAAGRGPAVDRGGLLRAGLAADLHLGHREAPSGLPAASLGAAADTKDARQRLPGSNRRNDQGWSRRRRHRAGQWVRVTGMCGVRTARSWLSVTWRAVARTGSRVRAAGLRGP